MKINKHILKISALALVLFSNCSKESDIELADYNKTLFNESFLFQENGTDIVTNWTNFKQVGNVQWLKKYRNDNAYVEFTTFRSGSDISNIAWLISPTINMDVQENEKLVFQSAQAFLKSRGNSLELMISSDFNGTNISTANWKNISFNSPTPETPFFTFINSGIIDLSEYKGKINIAFKVIGSGTNDELKGTYQLDNINVYYPAKK